MAQLAADPAHRVSTRRSGACGSSTWPTARRDSAAGYLDVGADPARALDPDPPMSADRRHPIAGKELLGRRRIERHRRGARPRARRTRGERRDQRTTRGGARAGLRRATWQPSSLDATDPEGSPLAARRATEALGAWTPSSGARATGSSSTLPGWDREAFARHVEVNLARPQQRARRRRPSHGQPAAGHIVGVASVAGYRGFPARRPTGRRRPRRSTCSRRCERPCHDMGSASRPCAPASSAPR